MRDVDFGMVIAKEIAMMPPGEITDGIGLCGVP